MYKSKLRVCWTDTQEVFRRLGSKRTVGTKYLCIAGGGSGAAAVGRLPQAQRLVLGGADNGPLLGGDGGFGERLLGHVGSVPVSLLNCLMSVVVGLLDWSMTTIGFIFSLGV